MYPKKNYQWSVAIFDKGQQKLCDSKQGGTQLPEMYSVCKAQIIQLCPLCDTSHITLLICILFVDVTYSKKALLNL